MSSNREMSWMSLLLTLAGRRRAFSITPWTGTKSQGPCCSPGADHVQRQTRSHSETKQVRYNKWRATVQRDRPGQNVAVRGKLCIPHRQLFANRSGGAFRGSTSKLWTPSQTTTKTDDSLCFQRQLVADRYISNLPHPHDVILNKYIHPRPGSHGRGIRSRSGEMCV